MDFLWFIVDKNVMNRFPQENDDEEEANIDVDI